MDIVNQLNQLAEMQAEQDAIHLHYQELREKVMTPEIKLALAEIDAEEQTSLEAIKQGVDKLTTCIKDNVQLIGASAKGDYLQAIYAKGRVSWDTKALDGYAAGHPEILPFRKEGEPSVSIRGVK